MKKILKTAITAAVVFLTAAVMAVCASAETEDVELDVSDAKFTDGTWQQSVTYTRDRFSCDRITPDSIVYVEFEIEGEWAKSGAPVELILQKYSSDTPQIWAKIPPFEMTDNSVSFRFEEMQLLYGSEDFSTVDAMYIGDCGIPIKITKLTITNCTAAEVVTTTAAETTTTAAEKKITTTSATTAAAKTTTAAETTAAPESESESDGKIPIIPIVIATVVVAVIVVAVIIILKSKRRFY